MRLAILGATGSIGDSALKVIDKLNAQGFKITPVLFSAHTQAEKLKMLCVKYNVHTCLVTGGASALETTTGSLTILTNPVEYAQFLKELRPDKVVIAQTGAGALPYLLASIDAGIDIALANKESLVMAGELISRRAAAKNVKIIPVDSEHSAIFQCINNRSADTISRIIITASGGPFYNKNRDELKNVTFEQAAKHPVWKMGKKISVDSATLMNKALEIIEAHYLFNIAPDKIDVVIHPQSIIHSMVEMIDGSIIARMAVPDMQLPIAYSITYPARARGISEPLDFSGIKKLTFLKYNSAAVAAIGLGYAAIKKSGGAEAVLNAANEEAVSLFSKGKILFTDIVPLVRRAMDEWQPIPVEKLGAVLKADKWARDFIKRMVN